MTEEPKQFDLVVTDDGQVVIGNLEELKNKLSSDVKGLLYSHLPDEFFRRQVQQAFEEMTKPKMVPATGDMRCAVCRSNDTSWSRTKECHHNMVPGPSTLQGKITESLHDAVEKKAREFVGRWAENGITDEAILKRLEGMVGLAAQAFVQNAGTGILAAAVKAFKGEYVTCGGAHYDEQGNYLQCNTQAVVGVPCPRCNHVNHGRMF